MVSMDLLRTDYSKLFRQESFVLFNSDWNLNGTENISNSHTQSCHMYLKISESLHSNFAFVKKNKGKKLKYPCFLFLHLQSQAGIYRPKICTIIAVLFIFFYFFFFLNTLSLWFCYFTPIKHSCCCALLIRSGTDMAYII